MTNRIPATTKRRALAPKRYLTDDAVSRMKPGDRLRDGETRGHPKDWEAGLGVRRGTKNTVTFFLDYTLPTLGEAGQVKLGRYGEMFGVTEARQKAREMKRDYILRDLHPREAIRAEREVAEEAKKTKEAEQAAIELEAVEREANSFNRVADQWLNDISKVRGKNEVSPNTYRTYEWCVRDRINPVIGDMYMLDIKRGDVDRVLDAARDKEDQPRTIQLIRAVVRRILNWKELDGKHLTHGVLGRDDEASVRERSATLDELARLGAILRDWPDQEDADIVRVILMAGARKSEIIKMKVAEVTLEEKRALIRGHKGSKLGKIKKPIYFAEKVRAIIAPRVENPVSEYVFNSHFPYNRWQSMCARAKIENLTLHDLRRTFIHFSENELDVPENVVRFMTGHVRDGTKQDVHSKNYANKMQAARILSWANFMAEWLTDRLEGKPLQTDNVVPLRSSAG